jgi:hypothetical protein
MVLGEVLNVNSEMIEAKNVFTLTKIKMPTDWNYSNLPTTGATTGDPIKVIMSKYDSFNHAIDTSVFFMKSGIVSMYTVDDKVRELYHEYNLQQAEIISDSPNPNDDTPTIADMIRQVLNEREESKGIDFDELRKNTIRMNKKKDE